MRGNALGIANILSLWYNKSMSIEHNDVFADIGYTTPDQLLDLQTVRAMKPGSAAVKRAVRASHRYRGRPPVGEDLEYANVDTSPTPLTEEEKRHQETVVWVEREQNIVSGLEADRMQAREVHDMHLAARLRAKLDAREKRWSQAGRGALQLMLPGMDDSHLNKLTKEKH